MRFKIFSATRFQRAVSPGIGVLVIGLWSLGCGGAASRGSASGGDAQPAADYYGDEGAVKVVRDYLDALDEGDLARAYGYWSDQTKADGLTFDKFQGQRTDIAAVRAEIGKARQIPQHRPRGAVGGTEGVTVPVELQITHTDGSQECAKGAYQVYRAVAGPPPDPWTISSSDIKEC